MTLSQPGSQKETDDVLKGLTEEFYDRTFHRSVYRDKRPNKGQ